MGYFRSMFFLMLEQCLLSFMPACQVHADLDTNILPLDCVCGYLEDQIGCKLGGNLARLAPHHPAAFSFLPCVCAMKN